MSDTTALDPLRLDAVWAFTTEDELFAEPYLDVDEERTEPVPHRYVHGGFRGTEARFSFYFPRPEDFRGRFFQHVTPFPQSELLAQSAPPASNKISFAVDNGAYFVETNSGGAAAGAPVPGADPTIGAYRANAAVARFSRLVAEELFGPGRVYGYLYGGSGGGYRAIGSSENTEGAWDGYAPHVIGSSMAIPNCFTVRMHAMRILRDRMPALVDAYDAGGDPASLELTEEERAAFEEVTRMGFPPQSWYGWKTMGMHGFSALYPGVLAADPTYTTDFWSTEGYLGADPTASVHRDRVQLRTRIAELIAPAEAVTEVSGGVDESFKHGAVDGAAPVAARFADTPEGWILGAELHVQTGELAGRVIRLAEVDGDTARFEGWQEDVLPRLAVGDEVILDNSNFLAVQTYHRHQVPGPDFPVWDQFRDAEGGPLLPQRPMLIGPLMAMGASGTVQSGAIHGKMIVVSCLHDREAFPWQADWYRRKVQEHLGAEEDERFRLWYIDNALHGDEDPQEFPARSVSYLGALETALLQLSDWVERGIDPAPTTTYEVVDGQVRVPASVAERGGVQPVITLETERLGAEVAVRIVAEAAGEGVITEIVEVVTDADGVESFGGALSFTPAPRVELTVTRPAADAGDRFLAFRVAAQSAGDVADPHAVVHNIARARVAAGR